MFHALQAHLRVRMQRDRVAERRAFLRTVAAGGLAAGALTWPDVMTLQADELRRRGKACILLWMNGGPSQFETFSPLPNHANGGATKAIATATPGIEISEYLPRLARASNDLAIIRSMTTKEGNHRRANILLHTGHVPTPTVKYPTLGSLISHEIGLPHSELPGYVQIGRNGYAEGGGGYLGVETDPFRLDRAEKLPRNAAPATPTDRFARRLNLLTQLEADYAAADGAQVVADHQKLYQKTARMILSAEMKAFDLEQETDATRDAYGRTPFGAGCLLARRLVEAGVTCVEVALNGWDTHDDNFNRSQELCGQIDQPAAQLLADLKQRGMLDDTLVVWMGEFGRTPKINPRAGRDHYPRAFNAFLAGGGVRGGQVIGRLDPTGAEVADRPVAVPDLFRSIYHALGIDASKEHMTPIGRPVPNVEGGEVVRELFG